MYITEMGSVVRFSGTSVRRELAMARAKNRPLFDTLRDEREARKAKHSARGVRLPSNIDTFDPNSEFHIVLAWCLNLRNNLNDRERRFLLSAFYYHGGSMFTRKQKPVQLVRDIFNLLWAYKAKWEEKKLRRHERLSSLDMSELNLNHVRDLETWTTLQLANLRSVA